MSTGPVTVPLEELDRSSVAVVVAVVSDRLSGGRIEEQAVLTVLVEVEHLPQGAGLRVERLPSDPAEIEVVLDEPQDGRLLSGGVVDEVPPRPGRDHQQRLTRAHAAAAVASRRAARL